MRVVLAFDSFKGSFPADVVCQRACALIRQQQPDWECVMLPMADGGEGTATAITCACGGKLLTCSGISGPLPAIRVDARMGWLPQTRIAIVEMAEASGLHLISDEQRDPMCASTRGTGELIAFALAHDPREILLTLGGSATVDGGTGAARALGWRFVDRHGRDLPEGGGALADLAAIIPPCHRPSCRVTALCDVTNPLCGRRGAARVYGPQKGATPEMVEILDHGLHHLAACIERDLGIAVEDVPGSGAAGGFGAGAIAFFGAALASGIQTVCRVCEADSVIDRADWVLTGEGCFDEQSFQGKVVSGIMEIARRTGAHVGIIAGTVNIQQAAWTDAGITCVESCSPPGMPVREAIRQAATLFDAAVSRMVDQMAGLP